MPLFQYQALNQKGKKISGVIEAASDQQAKEKLREQGIMLTSLESKARISKKNNLKQDDLMAFTVQLSQLFGAGVPLYESLSMIEEQTRGAKYHRVIVSLCESIKSGSSLSDAMSKFPESFDRLYIAMIQAGESSGALDLILERLSHYMDRRNHLKKQTVTALIYPAILAAFSLLIVVLLLGFVVPSIEGIFSERELNSFTNFVLGLSHFMQKFWWIFLPLVVGAIVLGVYRLRTEKGKLWYQRMCMKTPLISRLSTQTAIARFSRTMGTLLSGGLPMIEALRIARDVMGNVVLEEEIEKAEENIVHGSSLSKEIKRSKNIPHMVASMLSVGEETGRITHIFNKIADMYEGEVEKTLDRVLALAQPVILVVMGTIVGIIMLAILLPLTDMTNFAV